jgi:hypothetical protein
MPQSIQKWLEAGYELFSKEEPGSVQIEKLAFKYKTAVSAQMQSQSLDFFLIHQLFYSL